MPKKSHRRRKPVVPEPLSLDALHAIAEYCGYVLVHSRHHMALVDIRLGKTTLRGAEPVINHLRDLLDARPHKAELEGGL